MTSRISPDQSCPCGSSTQFASCCQPLLTGHKTARTAEQLMRSRYCAFVSENADYLIATHHPSKRQPNDKEQLLLMMRSSKWLQLQVLNTHKGLSEDSDGEVEFLAIYEENHQLFQLRENSYFVKENDCWLYKDGDINCSDKKQALKMGRNDPCYCGSGKKYKKCHG